MDNDSNDRATLDLGSTCVVPLDFWSPDTCRVASPTEMARGVFKGIDGCRDTWADWATCGVSYYDDVHYYESRARDYLRAQQRAR